MAQSVERRIGSAEVTGPIPVSSLMKNVGKASKLLNLLAFLRAPGIADCHIPSTSTAKDDALAQRLPGQARTPPVLEKEKR